MNEDKKTAKVEASISLAHHVYNGQDIYALPVTAGINVCAGEPDGTPCGSGCTCISQQPFYSADALVKIGVRPNRE